MRKQSISWIYKVITSALLFFLWTGTCFANDPDIPLSYIPQMELRDDVLYYEGRDGQNYQYSVQDGSVQEWDGTFAEKEPEISDWEDGIVVDQISAGDQQFQIIYRDADSEWGYYLDFCKEGISVLPEQMAVKSYTVCGKNSDMIVLVCKEIDQWEMVGLSSLILIDSSGSQTLLSQEVALDGSFFIGNGDTLLFQQEIDVNRGTQLCCYDLMTNEIMPVNEITKDAHLFFAIEGVTDGQSLFAYGEERNGISHWKLVYDDMGRAKAVELQEKSLSHTKPPWTAHLKPYAIIIVMSCFSGLFWLVTQGRRKWKERHAMGADEARRNRWNPKYQDISGMLVATAMFALLFADWIPIIGKGAAVALMQGVVYMLIRNTHHSETIRQQMQLKKLLLVFAAIGLLLWIPLPLGQTEKLLSMFLIGDFITFCMLLKQKS